MVRIAKDWDWPDLMRQTPGRTGVWDGIRFTLDDEAECDLLLVLNNRMKSDVRARCPEGRVWALMQEPYVRGFTDWMAEGHDAFARVHTSYVPSPDGKYVTSHPALPWHVNRNFDELVACSMPEKDRTCSWITGNPRDLPGHMKRLSFLHSLRSDRTLDVDLYGRAVRFVEDKWDGLARYRYSIAAENTAWHDYWTEKIADCFLTWTVPIYYGCPNLEKYFPPDSFIRIDIEKPREALGMIRRVLREDDWERRIPALSEARRRVLYEHQFFPHVARLVRTDPAPAPEKVLQTVPAYRRSAKTRVLRTLFKVRKHYLRLVHP